MHPKKLHHPHREGDLLHGVAFVIMKTPLHRHYRAAGDLPENQLPGVIFHRGNGEMGNIFIGNNRFLLNLIHQFTQAGSQHNADFRLDLGASLQILNRFLDLFSEFAHQ